MTQKNLTGYWATANQTYALTGTTAVALTVPAKTFVTSVGVIITTTCGGGTPLLDVGDGDNSDGWVDQADCTATTPGSYMGTQGGDSAYAPTGKYYATADTIDVVVSGSMSSGAWTVFAYFLPLADSV